MSTSDVYKKEYLRKWLHENAPRLQPFKDVAEEEVYHCEYRLYLERERLHDLAGS